MVKAGVDTSTVGCSAGGTSVGGAVTATELRGFMGCLPCTLAEGGAGEAMVMAVAVMEPDASRVTETLPDAVLMLAVASPSLLMLAVAMAGGDVAAAQAAAEAALLTL